MHAACRHRLRGESHEQSLKRHEHFLALRLGLKPGTKVCCHTSLLIVQLPGEASTWSKLPRGACSAQLVAN